jgi:uncharacterized protein YajQ (UPF0234 family)
MITITTTPRTTNAPPTAFSAGDPMASDHSFDIVSEVNMAELHNAVQQAQREISQRYDFRGSSAAVQDVDVKDKSVTITADNEPQLEAVFQVLLSKAIKRGVDARVFDRQKPDAATHNTFRQKVKLKAGIEREVAKAIQKQIKDLGLKVNPTIQGESVRVIGAKLDDLQTVQKALREKPPTVPVQFNNYK